MKNHAIVIVGVLLVVVTIRCVEKLHSSDALDAATRKNAGDAEFKSASYEDAIIYVWELADSGTRIEAKVQTSTATLKDSPSGMPLSKIAIRNLRSQKVIFEQSLDERPIYVIKRDLNGDGVLELIASWTSGAVGEQIKILTIDEDKATIVLDESYRVDASLVDASEKAIDVLITTAESGVSPAYTTRYVWQGEKYKPVGRVRYEHFVRQIKGLFGSSPSRLKRPPR